MSIEFRMILDRASENPAMSNNGGDYDFGRTIVVKDGRPVAVRYWTSADFDYCPHSGSFNRCEERRGCGDAGTPYPADIEGWESAAILDGNDREIASWRWEKDPARFYKVFLA